MPGSFPHARIFSMPGSFISPCQDLPHTSIIHFPLQGSSPCQDHSFPLQGSSPCQDHSFPLTMIFPMPGSFISPYEDLPHAGIIHFTLQGSSPCQDHSFPHTMIFPMPASFTSPTRITASSSSISMTTLYGDLNHLLQSAAF